MRPCSGVQFVFRYDGSVSDCCNCEVDSRALASRQRRVLIAVLAINVVTFVMMVGASVLSGSSALLSGTLDNFGDAVTYGLSFAVVAASATTKARVAFFKGLMILCAAVAVAVHIAWRLSHLQIPVVENDGRRVNPEPCRERRVPVTADAFQDRRPQHVVCLGVLSQ